MKIQEQKQTNALQDLFRFLVEYFKSSVRKRRLMSLEKICLVETNADHRKRWIVRGQNDKYIIYNEMGKRVHQAKGFLRSNISAMEMDKVADSIIMWDSKSKSAYVVGKR